MVLSGILDNTGASLDLSTLPASLFAGTGMGSTVGGGTIHGGTLATAGQTLRPGAAGSPTVLDGVTLSGTLDLAGGAAALTGGTKFAAGPGVVLLDSGSVRLDDGFAVASVTLGDGSTLITPHTVAGTTRFDSGAATLELTGTGALSATLSRFDAGDSVRLDGMTPGTLSLSGNVLTATDGATTVRLTLTDGGPGSYALSEFHLAADASGHQAITTSHAITSAASPLAAAADPLVVASFLFPQTGAASVPANGEAAAAALYKSGGWRTGSNPDRLFDTRWYMANYGAEVLASGLDPLTHYETVGWREGHDPSLLFSTRGYLQANPDVAAAGMNPLAHYLIFGQNEARVTHIATSSQPVDPLIDTARVAAEVATLLPQGGADPAAISAFYHGGGWRLVNDPQPAVQRGLLPRQQPRRGGRRRRSAGALREQRRRRRPQPQPAVRHTLLPGRQPGRRGGRLQPVGALRAARLARGAQPEPAVRHQLLPGPQPGRGRCRDQSAAAF